MQKRAFILFFCIILIFISSCSSDSAAGKLINVEIDGKPASLDPQLAGNDTEHLIARNIFEGLLRIDENGEVQPACAENLEISGLKYTFTLRKGLKWQNGDPLTAADFLFGIRRALLPETRSPGAEGLYSIKNAREIHEGKRGPGELGISSPDERTVIIELSAEDREFEYRLTKAAAMPCNEEFFNNTKGRYGLSEDNILCNGAFYIRRWETAEYVSLRKNTEYSTRKVRPSGAAIYFARDTEYRPLRLNDGRCDLAFGDSSMSEAFVEYNTTPNLIYNTTVMLALSPAHPMMKYAEIRDAFIKAIEFEKYSQSMPAYLMDAAVPVPPGLFARGYLYREASGVTAEKIFDPAAAKDKFTAVAAREKLTETTIELRYYDIPGLKDIAAAIAQGWQQHLGIVVNMSPVSSNEISGLISNKGFSAALIPFSAPEGSVKSFFSELCREEYKYLTEGSGIEALNGQINALISDEEYLARVESAEHELLKITTLTPVIYDGICFGAASNIDGAVFSLSEGYIDLAPVGKGN